MKLSRIRRKRHKKIQFRERFFHFQTFESYDSAVAEGGPGGAPDPSEFFRTDI